MFFFSKEINTKLLINQERVNNPLLFYQKKTQVEFFYKAFQSTVHRHYDFSVQNLINNGLKKTV